MIQIFSQQQRIVFITSRQDIFGLLGNNDRKGKAGKRQDSKAGIGEEFRQPELFAFGLTVWFACTQCLEYPLRTGITGVHGKHPGPVLNVGCPGVKQFSFLPVNRLSDSSLR